MSPRSYDWPAHHAQGAQAGVTAALRQLVTGRSLLEPAHLADFADGHNLA